jgi:hypothetical protein
MNGAELRNNLLVLTARRYTSRSSETLADYVFDNRPFRSSDRSITRFSWEHRDDVLAYFADDGNVQEFVEFCVNATKQYTYERNQFINISRDYDGLMAAEYRDLVDVTVSLLGRSAAEEELESRRTSSIADCTTRAASRGTDTASNHCWGRSVSGRSPTR